MAMDPLPTDEKDAPIGPALKVRSFPTTPGVYLMKDDQGVVIYVGKARNLRSRASSYFHKAAAIDSRTADLIKHIADIDYLETGTEVDALLTESRLIKDVQPRFNKDLKDGKSFPYLQIRMREEFPRVEVTRKPRSRGVKLFGPFTSVRGLRQAVNVLQKIFQFRNCSLDIRESEPRWRWYRPCLLHNIRQCTAPCNLRVTREEYRKQIRGLRLVLEGRKGRLIRELKREMKEAAVALQFERAARLRDSVEALGKLELRGDVNKDVQPHVFVIDPRRGLAGLRKALHLRETPRSIEGLDIAHLGGEDTVASLVCFLDGVPFKEGYRKFKLRTIQGIDDFASIREVVLRRFRRAADDESVFPDVLLIDGGKGQLNAARDAFAALGIEPPCLISLAKQDEEVFLPGEKEPLVLPRRSAALRLLQSVRDEAHRFAQSYLHTLRRKRLNG
ncbi:MAG: excinuclease ABC subunit UvrC [Gemmataceae bacterium]|nr:excinuclease ABC subunit UvrC [Gemmataceae bacterium]